jgi:hypothetical protein
VRVEDEDDATSLMLMILFYGLECLIRQICENRKFYGIILFSHNHKKSFCFCCRHDNSLWRKEAILFHYIATGMKIEMKE